MEDLRFAGRDSNPWLGWNTKSCYLHSTTIFFHLKEKGLISDYKVIEFFTAKAMVDRWAVSQAYHLPSTL